MTEDDLEPTVLQTMGVTVGQIKSNNASLTISDYQARELFTREFSLQPDQIPGLSYYLDVEGAQKYLIGKTRTLDGNCFSMALPLSQLPKTSESLMRTKTEDMVDDEKHSCSGADCESCSFVRNSTGEITGCECNKMLGYCNHTVST